MSSEHPDLSATAAGTDASPSARESAREPIREPTRERSRGWRGLHTVVAAAAVLGLALDQVTKQLALSTLSDGSVVPLLDGWLSLRLLRNSGAAFSLGEGATWVFTLAAVVVVGVIVRVAGRLGSRAWALTLGLLLAGALGNLADRLFREPGFARGHVVDFIDYNGWFVGNVADIFIVGAAIAVALLGVRGVALDGTRHGDDHGEGHGDDHGEGHGDDHGDGHDENRAAPGG